MEELFGGEEEAYEALQAIYSDLSETDWGVQYITENVDWDMIVAPTDEEDTETRPVTSSTIVAGKTAQVIITETASDTPDTGISSDVSEGETETEDSEISGGEMEDDAEEYLQWCSDTEAAMSKISGTQEIVFIEGWEPDAEIYWDLGNGEVIWPGAVCAYIRVGNGCIAYDNPTIASYTYYFRPLTDYLGFSNVTDFSDEPGAIDPWFRTETAYWTCNPVCSLKGSLCYITPVGRRLNSSCTATFLSSRSDIDYIYGYWRGNGIGITYSSVVGLGSGSFQTVVAKDQDTYDHLKDHWSWKYFNGGRRNGKWITWIIGEDVYYNVDGVSSTIMGNYNLIVYPAGVGDWVDSSPESILEGIWAAWQIQYEIGGAQTNGFSYSRFKNYIKDFYSEFHGYKLQDSDIDAILTGK